MRSTFLAFVISVNRTISSCTPSGIALASTLTRTSIELPLASIPFVELPPSIRINPALYTVSTRYEIISGELFTIV